MAGKQDIKAGSAYVELLLKDNKFVKGLKASGDKLKNFGTGLAKIGAGITAAGLALGAPLLAAAKHFADFGSELKDMSTRTGVSATALAELGYAAQQTGSDLSAVEGGIRKMQKFLTSAAEGSKEARLTLRDLGLTIEQLKSKSPEEQFQLIAESLANIQNPTERTAMAMKVLGKSSTALLPMIESLAELRAEARALGLAPTQAAVDAADDLGDAFDRISSTIGALVFNIGGALAPALTKIANAVSKTVAKVSNWVKNNGDLVRTVGGVAVALVAVGAAVSALGLAIAGLGIVIGGLATGLSAVGTVLGVVLSPLGLITAALVAGAYVWTQYTAAGQNAVSAFMDFLGPLLATFEQTFQGIKDAISGGDLMLAGQIAIAGLKAALLQGLAALSVAIGGAVGDLLGSVTSKLISGDFAGAWQDTISGLAEQWYAFSEGIVAAFTFAAEAVKNVWLKATSAIATAILDIAAKDGILGDLANKVLGYDDRENAKKTARMQAAARARGNDTVNMAEDGGAQATAQNILGGQAAAFQAKLDQLNAGRQKLTNDAARRRQEQVGGGADQAQAAADQAAAELEALTAQAKAAADKAAADDAARKDQAGAAGDLGGGIKQSVVGSFSASALAAGAAGGVTGRLDKIYEENKKFRILGAQTLAEQRAANRLS